MFQYAAARGLQEKFYPSEEINMNFKYVIKDGEKKKENGWNNQLGGFKLNKSVYFDKKVKLSPDQLFLTALYFVVFKIIKIFSNESNYYTRKRGLETKIQRLYNKVGLYFFSYGYHDFIKTNRANKLMIGYFESSKYFDHIHDKLVDEFSCKDLAKIENEDIYKHAAKKQSICISVRRGDFYSKDNTSDCVVCDEVYFKKAISEAHSRLNNMNVIAFSDDIEWVKSHMDYLCKYDPVYETGQDSVYEKMRMMSMCNNFIISNSSFSWWSQYLSKNKTKIVIAPPRWRNTNISLYNDIYEDTWIIVGKDK